MGGFVRKRAIGAVIAAGIGVNLLTACASDGEDALRYRSDYSSHQPLAVVGYPSTGSLQVTQEVVWAIADGDAAALEALASEDADKSDAEKTTSHWIRFFGKGAQGKVTADFYDEGSERQVVVLYFHDTSQIKEIQVQATNDSGAAHGWRVGLAEPDATEAEAAPVWAPKESGGLNSQSR
ncbi:hypothetical protein ACIQUQ_33245 [Streptomyces sp. NPDC101118]|uniref:hypothetical protein n=1 Tax=Streptomyces sp. NPDC101118 TaxID=3366109 RepID=UPI00381E4D05